MAVVLKPGGVEVLRADIEGLVVDRDQFVVQRVQVAVGPGGGGGGAEGGELEVAAGCRCRPGRVGGERGQAGLEEVADLDERLDAGREFGGEGVVQAGVVAGEGRAGDLEVLLGDLDVPAGAADEGAGRSPPG
ncbi:hypothetical protein [Kitasatospora sp. NPDC008115]|uniref:hypothetical protein n=1 Tax=Kitasatospora sp. NPDC008115 TaxID=3364022 RepID=UPI0036E61BD2